MTPGLHLKSTWSTPGLLQNDPGMLENDPRAPFEVHLELRGAQIELKWSPVWPNRGTLEPKLSPNRAEMEPGGAQMAPGGGQMELKRS